MQSSAASKTVVSGGTAGKDDEVHIPLAVPEDKAYDPKLGKTIDEILQGVINEGEDEE